MTVGPENSANQGKPAPGSSRAAAVVARVALFGVLALGIGGLAWYKYGRIQSAAARGPVFEPPVAVQIAEARQIDWQPTADLVGTVIAIRSVAVRNELAGVITQVGFTSGSIVEPGQVLVKLSDATDQADLEAAKASVRVAEASAAQGDARVRLAGKMVDRLTSVEGQAISAMELDKANSELETTRADHARWGAEVDQARARVAQFEARIAKLTLTAPFHARAGMRTVHEGQYLAEGGDVVLLQELTDKIFLDFAIPQEYAPRVAPGTTVMATGELLGPEPVPIVVVALDATVNNETRNLRVRAEVDNRRGTLVPGMFVQIRVPADIARPVVVVPVTAIRRASFGDGLFTVETIPGKDGLRARQRFVKLGPTLGEDVVVHDGVKAGERVAASGSFKLREGALVVEAAPGSAQPDSKPTVAGEPKPGPT